ncbi:Type 1 glutamine amidotransferase-like domain-containing protein [Bacillus sp. Marseille-Q3570]|uniref:Type 1 glutamine amidotransferase-like domain-containing protein n=1 Tax=Bacillus sp. Marseille-Q3570 TaxID=2963522 RepID=UPI0021B7D23A|nr:Type 1 glutamine amidotransferase-like domain-containing protein [Bacillus sp. Marseille-Q3570]
MSHLIMLSNIDEHLDEELEKRIRQIVSGKGSKLGYIPSQYDATKHYFNRMKPNLQRFGFDQFVYFDIDKEYEPENLEALSSCDAIYLSGGNTYYFLKNLRSRNMMSFLQDFVKTGGVLIGVSAGAMMMSPTIEVAQFLDPNDVRLTDFEALNLAQLHFLPHFIDRICMTEELETFMTRSSIPLYVCQDRAGIVIEKGKLKCYGKIRRADFRVDEKYKG